MRCRKREKKYTRLSYAHNINNNNNNNVAAAVAAEKLHESNNEGKKCANSTSACIRIRARRPAQFKIS